MEPQKGSDAHRPLRPRATPLSERFGTLAVVAASVAAFAVALILMRPTPQALVEVTALVPIVVPAPVAATPLTVPTPPPVVAKRTGPLFLNEGTLTKEVVHEPEDALPDGTVFINFFSEKLDGFPVLGSSVDVVVDGRPGKIMIQPASVPGWKKAVVHVPDDGAPHEVVYLPIYDLGADGHVTVKETMLQDTRKRLTYIVETPVDMAIFQPGQGRRRIKLKN